ncbi:Cytosine deaminase [Vibrio aestuarianus]|nr:Cytosine deaminase [Vibrio aestuarianus]
MGCEEIKNSLDLIRTKSARTLNIQDNYGIQLGKAGSLLILPAENGFDALRRQVAVRYSIRHGKVIAETQPASTCIHLEKTEAVTFQR